MSLQDFLLPKEERDVSPRATKSMYRPGWVPTAIQICRTLGFLQLGSCLCSGMLAGSGDPGNPCSKDHMPSLNPEWLLSVAGNNYRSFGEWKSLLSSLFPPPFSSSPLSPLLPPLSLPLFHFPSLFWGRVLLFGPELALNSRVREGLHFSLGLESRWMCPSLSCLTSVVAW